MNSFDLEHLRSFVTAVDAGSLTAAAPLRFLSQSALSEQLRKLEQHANQTLLLRSKSGVTPTAAGVKLLHHARHLLALSDAAWRDLQGVSLSGEIRLGITDYCRPADMIVLLARFARDYPHLKLRTMMGKSGDIEHAWQQGELDLAIVMRIPGIHPPGSSTREILLMDEPMLWVSASAPAQHEPLPLALLPEGCSLHRLACQTLKQHQLPYVIRHIASGVRGLQTAVIAGLGIACLNRSAVPAEFLNKNHTQRLPPLPSAEFVLLKGPDDNSETSQVCAAFSEILQATLSGAMP